VAFDSGPARSRSAPSDALSEVLRSVHIESASYGVAEFSAPWCVRGEAGVREPHPRSAGTDHIVCFHFVLEGGCRLGLVDGRDTTEASAGDLVLLPHDDRHIIGSDLHLSPATFQPARISVGLAASNAGGADGMTRLISGSFAFTPHLVRPLLEMLPRVLRVPAAAGPAGRLLGALLRAGAQESAHARPGSAPLLAKLAELIFVEVLRSHIEQQASSNRVWLAGAHDTRIGRAVALLHRDPSRQWTVEGLAGAVAMCRSALAERFAAAVGHPPMHYLRRLRLALAAKQLRAGREAIGRIAERSGYESETAFSRAFKREFGASPASWRRAARVARPVAQAPRVAD
jgi:AraC-like DNA-binding protein